jgi:hypothetical protein
MDLMSSFIMVLFTKMKKDDKIKDNQMGDTYSTNRVCEKCIQNFTRRYCWEENI